MPYFKWRGVDLTGRTRSGNMFAKSLQHLDHLLISRNVALLASKQKITILYKRPITRTHKTEFFGHLADLIQSGVLLPEALEVVIGQIRNHHFQEIVFILTDRVKNGQALSVAMSDYPKIFDSVMIQLVSVGEESGNMAQALEAIVQYGKVNQDFYSQLRTTLILPVITLGFFLLIAAFLFVFIVPRFADMFVSMHQELPKITRYAIALSAIVRSWYFLMIIGALLITCWIMKLFRETRVGRRLLDSLFLRVPFVGTLLKKRFIAYFLQSLALLVESGMQLVPALRLIQATVPNYIFAQQVNQMACEVESGTLLSDAMVDVQDQLWPQDVIAVVLVAQESGKLSIMLKKIAAIYHESVKKYLLWLTMVIQPFLMIILGFLILILIVAMYMPLFNLSHNM